MQFASLDELFQGQILSIQLLYKDFVVLLRSLRIKYPLRYIQYRYQLNFQHYEQALLNKEYLLLFSVLLSIRLMCETNSLMLVPRFFTPFYKIIKNWII